jgi:hypothetical protein
MATTPVGRKAWLVFFVTLAYFCLYAELAGAATVNAASCSTSDVQTAINSASSGDYVQVPGGSSSWSSGVTIPGAVGITVDGGGCTISATVTAFNVTTNATTTTRITNFNFVGSSTGSPPIFIDLGGSSTAATYRIDHNTFNARDIMVRVSGNGPGLLDHNSFSAGNPPNEMIHNEAMGASDASGWTDDVTPGSANMVFIEDNTFTFDAVGFNGKPPYYFWGSSAVQSFYGARTVFRYNTLTMVHVDQHGTCGATYARWWEIYENTFHIISQGNQSDYAHLRGGSGVMWGNNYPDLANNLGGNAISLVDDCSGTGPTWPDTDQVGRGINQGYSPAYLWGAEENALAEGDGQLVQAGRDFFASATQPSNMIRCEAAADRGTAGGGTSSCPTTYNYTPYTYPHPLQGNGPQPPTALAAVVH